MRHFTFGRNNGLRVSALALGAGTFGTRWGYGAAPEDVPRIFDTFADAGGTFIDTAASYQVGEAEENLGRLLDGRRDDFTVATKFAIGGPEGTGVLQTGNGRRAMFRSVEGSLRRLGTDYIDLLWVHFPDFVTPLDEIVRGLDDLARAGKILYAGLSNFPGMDDGTRSDARGVAWGDTDFGRAVGVQPRRTQRRPGEPADGRVARPRGGVVVAASAAGC